MNKTNKKALIRINYVELSTDREKSLLVVACNSGYRIYHKATFALLSEVDEFQQLIGSLSKASLYSNSKVIVFFGSESNNFFPPTQLIVWDADRRVKLGLLMFNKSIMDFYLGKRLLFISLSNKVLLFDFPSLTYIKTVHDIASNKHPLLSITQCPSTECQDSVLMAKVSCESFNTINTYQYKSKSNVHKHSETKQDISIKAFDFIKLILISSASNMLIVCSNYGNKIHLYAINAHLFTFAACIYLGNNIFEVSHFSFDSTSKYLFLLIDTQEMAMYKIGKLKQTCNCKSHADSITVKKKPSKGSLFGAISKAMSGITASYGRFEFTKGDNFVFAFFDASTKDLAYVLNREGLIIKMKMNKKEQGNIRIDAYLSLFNSAINE